MKYGVNISMKDELSKLKEDFGEHLEFLRNKYSCSIKLIGFNETDNSITASIEIIPPKSPEWIEFDIKL